MKILVTGDRFWTDRDAIERALEREVEEHPGEAIEVIQGGDGHYRARPRPPTDAAISVEYLCHTADGLLLAHRGADALAFQAASVLNLPCTTVWARWNVFGRGAGPERNGRMLALQPDLVLAFHDDLQRSRGTRDMLRQSLKAHVPSRRYWHKGDEVEFAEVAFF